jgi:LuxR family transcriptional regulator, maltose regulon positive regulatory protein
VSSGDWLYRGFIIEFNPSRSSFHRNSENKAFTRLTIRIKKVCQMTTFKVLQPAYSERTHPRRLDPRFTIPKAVPHEIERQELLEQLTQTQNLKLVVLEASGGYGKTTLLAQWARRDTKSTVWLTLSGSDNDPRYLSESLAKAIQINLPDLELLHWRDAFEASYGAGRIAEALCEDLNTLSVNLDICLDNGDDLTPEACQWIVQLTHFLGDDHRIIFAHRGSAPIKVARLVAAGTAVVISQDHLVFSKQETEHLLENAQPSQNVSSLHDHLEGWAAGLVLAGLHHANPNLSAKDLIHEILENVPMTVRQVLPEVCVLEVWSEVAATELGCHLPQGWLEQVRQAGMPLSPLGDRQYRPHQLVVEMLEKQLLKSPERYQELHNLAARHAETAKDGISAARHYAKAKQFEALNRLLLTLIPVWESRNEWGVIKQLLELVLVTELTPQFQALLGRAYLETGKASEARALFENMITAGIATARTYHGLAKLTRRSWDVETTQALVHEGLKRTKNPHERLMLTLEEAILLYNVEQNVLAKQTLEPVINLNQTLDSAESLQALGVWCKLLFELGETEQIGLTIEDTLIRVLKKGFSKTAVGLVSAACESYRINGTPEKAHALIEQLLPEWQRDEFLPGVATLLQQRSHMAMYQHDLEATVQYSRELLRVRVELGDQSHFSHIHLVFYNSLLRLDRFEEVKDFLVRSKTLEFSDYDRPHVEKLRGLYEFHKGHLEKAKTIFTSLLEQEQKQEQNEDQELFIDLCLYLAEIARKQGCLKQELIQPLQQHVNKKGFHQNLQLDSIVLQKLYVECVRRGWLAEHFKPYLTESKTIQAKQYTLTVKTLGTLEVTLNDKPIEFPYVKVTELLVYLCLQGSASRVDLSEILWNESRASNVYNAVNHLRQAFTDPLENHQMIVLEQKQYMLNKRVQVQLDVLGLEEVELEDTPEVLKCYCGDFLADIQTDWVQPLREHYRQRASSLAERYAASFKTSEPEIALSWYKRAVGIDPENADAFEVIVKLSEKLGRNDDAQLARTALGYLERGENPGVLLKSFAE